MTISYRTQAARTLLAEIEEYCARTNIRETVIGHALFRHPGFVGLLRLRLQLSEEKERIVRGFMGRWPNGYHGELPNSHIRFPPKSREERGPRPENVGSRLSEAEIAARRVDRDACPRCGVRGDIGCAHYRPSFGSIE